MREFDRRICHSKIAYPSRLAANASLADFQSRSNCRSKRIYNCHICGLFHLSSKPESAKRAKKIDKVIRNLKKKRGI